MPTEIVTPSFVKQSTTKAYQDRIEQLKVEVNEQLMNYRTGRPVEIPFLAVGRTQPEREDIINAIEKAGWIVGKKVIGESDKGKVYYVFTAADDVKQSRPDNMKEFDDDDMENAAV